MERKTYFVSSKKQCQFLSDWNFWNNQEMQQFKNYAQKQDKNWFLENYVQLTIGQDMDIRDELWKFRKNSHGSHKNVWKSKLPWKQNWCLDAKA